MRFPYAQGTTRISAPGVKPTDLPGGPLNHHCTSCDGARLYATEPSLISYADCCEHPKSSCGPGGRHGRLGATFSEVEVRQALERLDPLWDELLPTEQA